MPGGVLTLVGQADESGLTQGEISFLRGNVGPSLPHVILASSWPLA
jgi:hypothetical protein